MLTTIPLVAGSSSAIATSAAHGHAGPAIFQAAGMVFALMALPFLMSERFGRVADRIGAGLAIASVFAFVLLSSALAVVFAALFGASV